MGLKFWQRPLGSWHTAYNLFGMISGTQTPLPQIEGFEHAIELIGDTFSLSYTTDHLNQPRIIQARSNEALVIGISGAQTIYMFQGLVNGYMQPPSSFNNGGVNPFATSQVVQIGSAILDILPGFQNVLIGGYSYGSVIAWGLYHYLNVYSPGKNIRLITYGEPKPFGEELRRYYQGAGSGFIRQICNDNDPVPFVYPDAEQAPNLHRAVSNAVSRNQSGYAHALPFQQLDASANGFREVAYPTNTNADVEIAIASWMAGTEGWNTSGHHWTTYKQRLFQMNARFPDTPEDAQPRLVQSIDEAQALGQLIAETPLVIPPLYSVGDPPVPMPASPIPSGQRPKGTLGYSVTWNGAHIATFRTRSAARRLRNTLKRLATSFRQSREFSSASVGEAIELNYVLESNGIPTHLE